MQVQSGNERFANVDSFGPVDWVVIHADKGALKANGEYQLLLFKEMLEKRVNKCKKHLVNFFLTNSDVDTDA